ncbi:MAG: diguanylate cyclase [Candidatus Omnitrophota bacterium]
MKILIVDDSKTFRQVLKAVLSSAGYNELIEAESAKEAFDILKISDAAADDSEVDLILMDIVMPEIDGIEATRIIKSMAHLRDIPIVMVSALSEEDSLVRAFDVGAIDFINKPINKVELRARVRTQLKLKNEINKRKAREKELIKISRLLEDANAQLKKLSELDGLTNIPNRRCFDRSFKQEWMRGIREYQPVAILMIDIDYFKAYNDHYGHQQGDTCLRQIALAVSDAVKRPGDLAARYGGEEFVVYLSNTSLEGAVSVAVEIQDNVNLLAIEHAASIINTRVTVSIGCSSMIPDPSVEPDELIKSADRALYKAKRLGRNKIQSGVITPFESAVDSNETN